MLLDGLKQLDPGVAEEAAKLGIDFQLAAQAMCDRIEFAVLVTLSCHVYNDSGSTQPGVGFSPFSALRHGCMVLAGEGNVMFGARNPLAGMVESVSKGAVNCEVGIKLKGGTLVYAVVTNKAVLELGLKPVVPASALIKVSHVVLGVPA